MSDKMLRRNLIRLAHEMEPGKNRTALLNVLEKTALDVDERKTSAVVDALENEVKALRGILEARDQWLKTRNSKSAPALKDLMDHLDDKYEHDKWSENVTSRTSDAMWSGLHLGRGWGKGWDIIEKAIAEAEAQADTIKKDMRELPNRDY